MRGRLINDSKEGREHDRINGKSFKDRSSPKMGGMYDQGKEDSKQLENAGNKMRSD